MSNTHTGNVQPAIDQEEHSHIGGVPGKKVFNIDSNGNVLNFTHITAAITGGATVYQGSTPWNSMATALNAIDPHLEIARGNVTGHSLVHKFGAAPDFDTGDNEVTIWDAADDSETWQNMAYNYSSAPSINSISSSNAGDSVDIEIQGLDENFNLLTQTVTLNGQSFVSIPTAYQRVFRAKNVGSTNLAGNVFVYENDTLTGGVPDDAELIRAVIQPENNQTEMAIYTIPAGKSGYLRGFYASIAGVQVTADFLIKLKSKPDGQVFQLKHKFVLNDGVDTNYHHVYTEPQKFNAKTDLEMTAQILTGAKTGGNVIAGFDIVLVDN